jgi:hypothetical protein
LLWAVWTSNTQGVSVSSNTSQMKGQHGRVAHGWPGPAALVSLGRLDHLQYICFNDSLASHGFLNGCIPSHRITESPSDAREWVHRSSELACPESLCPWYPQAERHNCSFSLLTLATKKTSSSSLLLSCPWKPL